MFARVTQSYSELTIKGEGEIGRFITIIMAVVLSAVSAITQANNEIPSEVTLFKNVNIWDGTSESLKKGYDVLVVRNLIKKIAKDIPTSGTYELDVKSGGYKEIDIATRG